MALARATLLWAAATAGATEIITCRPGYEPEAVFPEIGDEVLAITVDATARFEEMGLTLEIVTMTVSDFKSGEVSGSGATFTTCGMGWATDENEEEVWVGPCPFVAVSTRRGFARGRVDAAVAPRRRDRVVDTGGDAASTLRRGRVTDAVAESRRRRRGGVASPTQRRSRVADAAAGSRRRRAGRV